MEKPSEKSRKVRKTLIKFSNLTGVHLKNDPKMHPRLLTVLILGTIFIFMTINGALHAKGDPKKLCHALYPSAIIFVFIGRAVNKIVYKSEVLDRILQRKTEEFYEKWEDLEKFKKILHQRINESAFYTRIMVFATFVCYHLPFFVMDIENLMTGNRMYCVYSFFPFIDHESDFGFIINNIYFHIGSTLSFFTTVVLDSMLVLYGYQAVPMCDIMIAHIKESGDELWMKCVNRIENESLEASKSTQRPKKQENVKDSFQKFKYLALDHQMYNEYINDIIRLMELPCFLSVVFNSLSIGLSVVITFNISVKLGIAAACLFFSQVFTPCCIGALIQNQNERLLQKFCEFPWFLLDKHDKKIFLELIHAIQNTAVFKMPMVGVLNMYLFTDVMSASYFYFNYFYSFVQK